MHFVMVEREGERNRERERKKERESSWCFWSQINSKKKLEVKSLNSDQSNPKILTPK